MIYTVQKSNMFGIEKPLENDKEKMHPPHPLLPRNEMTVLTSQTHDRVFIAGSVGLGTRKKTEYLRTKLLCPKWNVKRSLRNEYGFLILDKRLVLIVSFLALTLQRPGGGGQMDSPIGFSDLKFEVFKQTK